MGTDGQWIVVCGISYMFGALTGVAIIVLWDIVKQRRQLQEEVDHLRRSPLFERNLP